ncbi:MAG TPA: 5-dehydro-2-deoxygluconokinase [Steroidobacteraceae bacterium]|nr:5-dehydro-2-deoxygluconokinase [Steroidobacteraceae bacterium]
MSTTLDLVAIGRVSVDLYGQQVGSRLEDIASFSKAIGGSPANVAIGAARLGLKAALITRVGDEPMGRFVREQLEREGVGTRAVHTDPERLTSLVLLSVRDAETFPLIFYRENCADSALDEGDIDAELIGAARATLVTGTHFSLPAGARAQRKAIEVARSLGRKVVLDIDYRPNLWGLGGHDAGDTRYERSAAVTAALASVLPSCDLIVGTEEEIHIAAGHEDTLEAMRRIRAVSGAVIVLKRGARGCVLFAERIPARLEDALVAPGLDVEVYNVLGAGDAFLAGFLLGYLRDAPHAVSLRLANACGAIAVSRLMCSVEFATLAELTHYLARGSRHHALRRDPQLAHLHWATTRRAAPGTLFILDAAAVSAELGRLMVEAAAQVAATRGGVGVRLGSTTDISALRTAQREQLWIAQAVEVAGERPLEFVPGPSFAARLIEWPSGITVSCRFEVRAEDEPPMHAAQERNLRRLAAACRAQGRELLLEIAGAASPATVLRLYEIGIRPDWWALGAADEGGALEASAQVVSVQDEYCHGVLTSSAAAASPVVRGFIAGGSIFTGVVTAWLAGRASDESLIREIADLFQAQIAAWLQARDA